MKDYSTSDIALVFGNTGGIGKSIYTKLINSNRYEKVYGFNRNSDPSIDITNEKSLQSIANKFSEQNIKIKLLINAVGYLHDKNYLPEKKFQDISSEYMKKTFEINTIPTALLIKYFTPFMKNSETSIFATISAKVGSISDNFLGGWYSYRASKAALNQIVKTASVEYKRKNPNLIIISIHPGTVSTKLSKPFIGNKKVQTTDEAALKIINVLNNLKPKNSGYLIDYNNNIIPF